jgi:hypothetical protein
LELDAQNQTLIRVGWSQMDFIQDVLAAGDNQIIGSTLKFSISWPHHISVEIYF